MSVNFKAIARKNPQDLTLAPLFYAIVENKDQTNIKRLTQLVSDGSTVRENDIHAVLIGLVNVIIDELAQGRSVELGTLGTFRLSISSSSSPTTEDVTVGNIKKAKILYRPGPELREKLKILQFTKVS